MIYYPSAQLALWVRVEEFAATGSLDRQLGQAIAARTATQPDLVPPQEAGDDGSVDAVLQNIAMTNDRIRTVARQDADAFPGGAIEREQILSELRAQRDAALSAVSDGGQQRRIEGISGSSPDDRFVRGGIAPRRATIDRNGFRSADTCSLELAWEDIPFDPRLLRSFGVELIVGAVRGAEYQDGVRGDRDGRGQLLSVIQQDPAGLVVRSATRFVGRVDEVKVEFDSDEGALLYLECRDLTAQFIDQPLIAPDLDLTLPIDVGMTALLAQYPALAGMPVIYGDVDDLTPGPAPIPGASVALPRRARRGRVVRQARSGDQKMSLWDYITDVCVQVGLVPIVRDYELRLCRPDTLYGTTTTAAPPDAGVTGGLTRPRRMVYGRNVSSLTFKRKLGGTKVPTIEVRAYDALVGRTRWARWPVRPGEVATGIFGIVDPPAAIRATEISPSGANPDERVQTFTVRYATDPRVLQQIARTTYEEIGRQEIEGSFKTSDLSSFESPEEADLLRLLSGDPVEILVAAYDPLDPTQVPTSATELAALETSRRAAYLRSLGWDDAVAARFAQLQDASGLQSIFRTTSARIDFDADDGVEVEVDFINYVTVRAEPIGAEAASPQVEGIAQGADALGGARARAASARRRQVGRYVMPDPELGDVGDRSVIPSQQVGDLDARTVTPAQELGDYEEALQEERDALAPLQGYGTIDRSRLR